MAQNLIEILVANGVGTVIIILLLLSRKKYFKNKTLSSKLFDAMLYITLVANVVEIITFFIDGKTFFMSRFLQLLTNAICIASTIIVGYLWSLYADLRIHKSDSHMKKAYRVLAIPALIIVLLLIADMFGAKLLFEINESNYYVRGKYSILVYILLFCYYFHTIILSYYFRNKKPHIKFFPILYFVFPCIVGTILQGFFYGFTFGWLSVSIALAFVQLNHQGESAYIDQLTGLYNRNYYDHFFERISRKKIKNIYGVSIDLDKLKEINDNYGHQEGDNVIRMFSLIMLNEAKDNIELIRVGGDEFLIIIVSDDCNEPSRIMNKIINQTNEVNQKTDKPYKISFSYGIAHFDGENTDAFLTEMDRKLYECKKQHHQN